MERVFVLLEKGTRDFRTSPLFERSACFYVSITGSFQYFNTFQYFNVFNTLTLKKFFKKIKNFFNELEYPFLVQSSKIEKASFPYKTVTSVADVKTSRMLNTK